MRRFLRAVGKTILLFCLIGVFLWQGMFPLSEEPFTFDFTKKNPEPDAAGEGAYNAPFDQDSSATSSSYPQYLESTSGLFTYYSQGDSRWADAPYGQRDRISSHGCGPTALAMIVSSYAEKPIAPDAMAKWASDSGFCIPGEGSLHSIIPQGCQAFGLSVTSMEDYSAQAILSEVRAGRVVTALVKTGYFSSTSGHFLIIIRADENGQVWIADPGNPDNNLKSWEPEFIIGQLKYNSGYGGPLWSVGAKIE